MHRGSKISCVGLIFLSSKSRTDINFLTEAFAEKIEPTCDKSIFCVSSMTLPNPTWLIATVVISFTSKRLESTSARWSNANDSLAWLGHGLFTHRPGWSPLRLRNLQSGGDRTSDELTTMTVNVGVSSLRRIIKLASKLGHISSIRAGQTMNV
jgi:hypothetical protein